ncbi:glycosyltransferase family 39 protein [Kribbella sp. NBC_01484]|uniref:ArnT family glycosyltransferase n=1 Tax=Kribbella sp. NBC_01484 TaxID=2903579 RepID=UPI002E34C354|nr:glycosyltransferase family 39 protein [Kribbella sp. NBC_01484]
MTSLLDPPRTHSVSPDPPARPPGRVRRVIRGPAGQAAYVRPAALGLLIGTAFLYLWNLTASSEGNSFYAAAELAGTQSWKAWLFGSLDAGNAITVDKPPAALWVATAFARIFGFNSFTVLAPQALMGIAAVGLLYLTVKRLAGPAAGLIAGTTLALTPVAVLMFRFNNPDALLVLLMVAAAYFVVRSLDKASARWLALAGVAIGFAFLTKMMQAFLVLPAFGLVYLIAAPTSLRRRLLHLLGALGAVIVSAGWYVALVELWPASSRPDIGGSTNNSMLELALGYNGLGRLLGGSGNGGGGGNGTTGFGGSAGITRMFGDAFGTEISWLLPAAFDRVGRWVVADASRAADGSLAGRARAVGRVVARDRGGLQLHEWDGASVLRDRAGTGDRRAGGDWCVDRLAATGFAVGAADAGRDGAGDRRVGLRVARPYGGLHAVGEVRCTRGRRDRCSARDRRPVRATVAPGCGARARGVARSREYGIRGVDGFADAQRLDPDLRPEHQRYGWRHAHRRRRWPRRIWRNPTQPLRSNHNDPAAGWWRDGR